MGLRFQKRISILPGLRINLSRSGASASIGPRGADVNIGRNGITTNAGIPGSGLSWRAKLGTHGSWFGVVLLVGALAFWVGSHAGRGRVASAPDPQTAALSASTSAPGRHGPRAAIAALKPGPVYVHRGGSVLRGTPKPSGKSLKKEAKGASVTLLEPMEGGWARVRDGALTGYMRASILGEAPPQ